MEIETMHYDPHIDRLIGCSCRELDGGLARSFLLPLSRAIRIKDGLLRTSTLMARAFPAGTEDVQRLPQVLAIIDPGVRVDGGGLPPEYDELSQLVTVTSKAATLDDSALIGTGVDGCATTLFSTLRVLHFDANLALTRGRGTSVQLNYITVRGELIDPYFLIGPKEVTVHVWRSCARRDLELAMFAVCVASKANSRPIRTVLARGLASYLSEERRAWAEPLVDEAAGQIENREEGGILRTCERLATALFEGQQLLSQLSGE